MILAHTKNLSRFGVLVLAAVFALGTIAKGQDDPVASAVEFFNNGQDAHEKGDLKRAAELYRQALKDLPEFPEAEYQLGNALLALELPAEAEAAFRRAVELRDDWSLPLAALGSVLIQRAAFAEAETVLEKAIELDAQSFPALAALAELKLRTKAPAQVLSELLGRLRTLTGKANPPVAIWIARASLERALGDFTSAGSSVERALALEPKNRSAIAERAEIALATNDAKSAVADAEMLLRAAPESPSLKFLLARALAANGRTSESLKLIETIQNKNAEMLEFRDRVTAVASTDPAELEKQLESDPKNAPVLGRLCTLLRAADPQKALDYCRRAYEADPKNLDYVIGFGAALVQAKQFENAVSVMNQIIGVAPDNYTARANLAVALFQLKRFADAKREYQWLANRRPDLAIAYYFLGIIHDQLKEYLDAMANYQLFLKLADPEQQKLEIEKVNLRLPGLQRQIKRKE